VLWVLLRNAIDKRQDCFVRKSEDLQRMVLEFWWLTTPSQSLATSDTFYTKIALHLFNNEVLDPTFLNSHVSFFTIGFELVKALLLYIFWFPILPLTKIPQLYNPSRHILRHGIAPYTSPELTIRCLFSFSAPHTIKANQFLLLPSSRFIGPTCVPRSSFWST
jgi:hypothetical protein